MTVYNFLLRQAQSLPAWLKDWRPGNGFDPRAFFSSRVVYYPGACTDGHAVKVFGSTHSAHCFVYTDNGVTKEMITSDLGLIPGSGFKGYHTHARLDLTPADILTESFTPHLADAEICSGFNMPSRKAGLEFFAFLDILERNAGLDDGHGPARLAFLYMGTDGITAYDALFCQHGRNAPYGVLLQDHGFSGNYSSFGADGLLNKIIERSRVYPRWVLAGRNTRVWHGYTRVPDVDWDCPGRNFTPRYLYERREWEGM